MSRERRIPKILAILSVSLFLGSVPDVYARSGISEQAIVILAGRNIAEMQIARAVIERSGATIRNIFPPSTFIADIPDAVKASLEQCGYISKISYDKLETADYSASVQDAISVWNRRLQMQEISGMNTPSAVAVNPGNEAEFKAMEYAWGGYEYDSDNYEVDPRQQVTGGFSDPYGKAYGGGKYDTSLYLAGDVAVGVFFKTAPAGGRYSLGEWEPGEIEENFAVICNALDRLIDEEPNAHLTFTFINEGSSEPPPEYVSGLRKRYNTHWAYMVIDYKRSKGARAGLFGPYAEVSSYTPEQWMWLDYTARHETMHVFGAMDEYTIDLSDSDFSVDPDGGSNGPDPRKRYGYLNVVNANASGEAGGYFNGHGEMRGSIMGLNTGAWEAPVDIYTRGQLGWLDSDGDGILDPLDTFPHTVILKKTGVFKLTYSGKAIDKPLLSEAYTGSVTLNTIARVEYRINRGAWIQAEADDGAFDRAEESFHFTTPDLSDGKYRLEVRATNSVLNSEVSYASDEILISGSPVTNVKPFAAFSVNPAQGSIYSRFTFDASESADIEDNKERLAVSWNFGGMGWTKYSNNLNASCRFTSPGVKTVQLRLKDSSGEVSQISKQVQVFGYNMPPKAFFVATSENKDYQDGWYKIKVDSAGSWDAEDKAGLKAGWDFGDESGIETAAVGETVEHSYKVRDIYSKRWRITLEVKDKNGNTGKAVRDVCVVPYNHSPLLKDIQASGNSNQLTLVCGVSSVNHPSGLRISGHYLYVNDAESGLNIFDLSSAQEPLFLGSCYIKSAHGVFVSGRFAYVSDNTGLNIVDVSNPGNPVLKGRCFTHEESLYYPPSYFPKVYVYGSYAYIADGYYGGLHIIDVSDPRLPWKVTTFEGARIFDAAVSGNYAYFANGADFQALDISNPGKPVLAGKCRLPDGGYSISVFGRYAYVGGRGLYIIDISSPAAPVLKGHYASPDVMESVCIFGRYAFMNTYMGGIQIADISDPQRPVLEDEYEGNYFDLAFSGRYLYAADPQKGLNVYRLSQGIGLTALGEDQDKDTTWDGLLEYRWDFDNDFVWDTSFNNSADAQWEDFYINDDDLAGAEVKCQVRDRFGASDTKILPVMDMIQGGYRRGWVPVIPQVNIQRTFSGQNVRLNASWVSSPDLKVEEYLYAIGSSPGASDILGWRSSGMSVSIAHTFSLFRLLTQPAYYYVNVKARNASGLSEAGVSEGKAFFKPSLEVAYLTEVKAAMTDTPVLFKTLSPAADTVYLLIRGAGNNSAYFRYNRAEKKLYWMENGRWAGGIMPGERNHDGSDLLSTNPSFQLNCSLTTVDNNDDLLKVNWYFIPRQDFKGGVNVYYKVESSAGQASNWLRLGNVEITGKPHLAPVITSGGEDKIIKF